jgi:hypothetical protein
LTLALLGLRRCLIQGKEQNGKKKYRFLEKTVNESGHLQNEYFCHKIKKASCDCSQDTKYQEQLNQAAKMPDFIRLGYSRQTSFYP